MFLRSPSSILIHTLSSPLTYLSIKRYKQQYQLAQNLRQKKHFLKQKLEHYLMMEELLSRKLKT